MKEYYVSDLAKEIKIVLDRNTDSSALIATDDLDTLTQEEIMESKIVDAARLIEEQAPVDMLDGGEKLTGELSYRKYGNVYVFELSLKNLSFMRLITIKMGQWERPGKIITEEDAEYQWQSSRWSGIHGNPQKPIAAIVQGEDGLCLELYSCTSPTATIEKGTYLKIPSVSSGKISLCPKLKDAIVYMAAYLTCITLGDQQTANGLLQVAYELAHIPLQSAHGQTE